LLLSKRGMAMRCSWLCCCSLQRCGLGGVGASSEAELGVVLLLTAAREEAATLDVDPKRSGGEASEIWRPDDGGHAMMLA
jgi:hypothetical protein